METMTEQPHETWSRLECDLMYRWQRRKPENDNWFKKLYPQPLGYIGTLEKIQSCTSGLFYWNNGVIHFQDEKDFITFSLSV